MKGKLIVICGIDGSGKSTLLEKIQEQYEVNIYSTFLKTFQSTIFTNELEMVAGHLGMKRRECFSADLRSLVWMDDLLYNYFSYIEPELNKGKVVFIDRYTMCNKVYSIYMSNKRIRDIFKIYDGLRKPDLLLYLDVSVDIAMKRIKKRKIVAPYENYHDLKRIKSLYEEEIQKSQFPVYRINADLNLDKVVEETINIIEKIII